MTTEQVSHSDKSVKPLSEAFLEIARLAERLGIKPLNELAGCWEYQIDRQWFMAVNGHNEPIECSMGVSVPPFHAYVQFNGWPAGIIDASGSCFAAGDLANLESFNAALEAVAS